MTEKNIFLNGGEVGGVAGSADVGIDPMSHVARKLKMAGIPVGDQVSTKFPWIRYTRELLNKGIGRMGPIPGKYATEVDP